MCSDLPMCYGGFYNMMVIMYHLLRIYYLPRTSIHISQNHSSSEENWGGRCYYHLMDNKSEAQRSGQATTEIT